ncbi:uncharacterized protein LOC126377211 [Pectinophora gossypiella]|uniref:uncharacterized protein LOC126377211 n=1 Tax=Pectinophora gossypiella TaxID=13191 RepID=UPI00214E1897|nr:uncharacterized protein LOC126377211 [Pectinophora gossypiella]
MGKPKYELPSLTFPYKISRRLNLMSLPRRYIIDTGEGMPAFTSTGVRNSALRGHITDRVNDAAWPWVRRLIMLKRTYKNKFHPDRLEKLDRMIEASNATMYSKLANCMVDLKKQEPKDAKKKRGWTESEWKKHMDYIGQIAGPRKEFQPPPVKRGKSKPLDQLLGNLNRLAQIPEFKVYRRLSEEEWYRDPTKVSPNAMKYVISDRVKKLATPRAQPAAD